MGRVLITGCSSGFGELTALTLARRGEHVVATMRNLERGEALRNCAREEGLSLVVRQLDVQDDASIRKTVAEVLEEGPLDGLVNNAGRRGPCGPLSTFSDEDFMRVFDVNVLGVLRVTRAVVPAMVERGQGTVVTVSSMAGVVGAPYESAYSASKHAVEAMAESLRWELAPRGVRVKLIQPGAFDTGFFGIDETAAGFGPDHAQQGDYREFSAAMASNLLGELLQPPQMVADAVADALLEESDNTFRRPVGKDAVAICDAKKSLPYDQYENRIVAMIDLPTSFVL